MTVSNDPLPVSSEARFDLMPGITPEHRDLGYCNCHPAEKGFDADCGLPQHRAEHKRRSEQHEQVMKVEKVLDATRDDTPRKSDVQHSAGQKLPDQTVNSVEELHASLRAIIPPDVHELGPDPFVNGYRQGILFAMQAAGIDVAAPMPFIAAFTADVDPAVAQQIRDELGRRAEQLRRTLL